MDLPHPPVNAVSHHAVPVRNIHSTSESPAPYFQNTGKRFWGDSPQTSAKRANRHLINFSLYNNICNFLDKPFICLLRLLLPSQFFPLSSPLISVNSIILCLFYFLSIYGIYIFIIPCSPSTIPLTIIFSGRKIHLCKHVLLYTFTYVRNRYIITSFYERNRTMKKV